MKINFKKEIEQERPLGYLLKLDENNITINFRLLNKDENKITGSMILETTIKRPRELNLIWGNFVEVCDFIDEIQEDQITAIGFSHDKKNNNII
ncbi:MAG: hypothetical protein ACJAVA_000350 [Flavobacteriaceae bacterium]|jgi:hypothetical protein